MSDPTFMKNPRDRQNQDPVAGRFSARLTRRFPELAAAVAALEPPMLLLDGEIAVFDQQLVSHFEWLRSRPKDDTATPPLLMAFDCLYARGKDLRTRAFRTWPGATGPRGAGRLR